MTDQQQLQCNFNLLIQSFNTAKLLHAISFLQVCIYHLPLILTLVKVKSRYWPRTFGILSLGTVKINSPAQFDEPDWTGARVHAENVLQRVVIFDWLAGKS